MLLSETFGDPFDEAYFAWWLDRNPAGQGYLTTVEDADGATAGVHGMSFVRWSVDGAERQFGVSIAAATDPRFRGRGVFRALEEVHDAEAGAAGAEVGLAYNPSPASWPVFVGPLGWQPLRVLRVWARPLRPRGLLAAVGRGTGGSMPGPVATHPEAGGVRIARLARPDGDADRLWARVAPAYGSAAARTASYLAWRYVDAPRPYRLLGAYRDGELAGLAVVGFAERRGIAAGTLADLVADPADRTVVRALLAAAARELRPGIDLLIALEPPRALRRVFLASGLVPTPRTLRIAAAALRPEGRLDLPWTFTLGDFDFM